MKFTTFSCGYSTDRQPAIYFDILVEKKNGFGIIRAIFIYTMKEALYVETVQMRCADAVSCFLRMYAVQCA